MRLKLGTRGSALAVAQAETVAERLRGMGHTVELVRIKTRGDRAIDSLIRQGELGVFAAELREAILEGRCDFAVHSFKDLPVAPVPGLTIAAVPTRADARDALCSRGPRLSELPAGARVGTGSPRRVAQLRARRPDLNYVDVRGNLGTRLARVSEGDVDAVVLAVAGLTRSGRADAITEILDILPAPAQGALALECRADAEDTLALLATLDDPDTRREVEAERALLRNLGGGCAAPIAAWAHDGRLEAGVFAIDGSGSATAGVALSERAGDTAAEVLMGQDAGSVADLSANAPSRIANLHDDVSLWGGETSLAGLRVFYPRTDDHLAEAMRAAGAEVVAEPVLERINVKPESTLDGADWVVITSEATVDALREQHMRIPYRAKVAAVGPSTAEALRAAGYSVDLVPAGGQATAATLAAVWPTGRGTVAMPGSALSSTTLAEALKVKGYEVNQFAVYTVAPVASLPQEIRDDFAADRFDAIAVLSGSMGQAVGHLLGWPDPLRVVAFGPATADALALQGVRVTAVAETQDARGLIAAVAEAGRTRP